MILSPTFGAVGFADIDNEPPDVVGACIGEGSIQLEPYLLWQLVLHVSRVVKELSDVATHETVPKKLVSHLTIGNFDPDVAHKYLPWKLHDEPCEGGGGKGSMQSEGNMP